MTKPDDQRLAAEALEHGGLVALAGGPASCQWHFKDWYLTQDPECWRRAGYVETRELVENPVPELRGYGMGVVWRFDSTVAAERQERAA